MKLARTVEHTADVDGLAARLTPEQVNEWIAEYAIEPWDINPLAQPEEKPASALSIMRQQAGV